MNEDRLIPKRRFKEFENDGAWEQRKLGEVVENIYNGQTPSRFSDNNWGGNINWLTSGELNRGVVTETIEKITPVGQKNANLRIVPKGTFVIAITGLEAEGTRGNCAKLAIDTTLNQSCMALFPKQNVLDADFLFQWYRKIGEDYGIEYTQGTKQQSYNAVLIKILPITLPKIEEQTKIARFLDNLDNLITLHQRKLKKLKETKSAYLSEIFPKEGEIYPKRRFAGFTEAWEQRKVKDVFKVTRGHVLAATKTAREKTDSTPYPVYSSQTANEGLMGYYNDYLYTDAITWTTDGANAGTVNYRKGKFYCTNVCGVLISEDGYANKMVSEALNKVAWKHVSKVGNPKLMNNVMSEIVISMPKGIQEQEKISGFFDRLDNLITLHEHKLEKLENLKKAYLNEMFV